MLNPIKKHGFDLQWFDSSQMNLNKIDSYVKQKEEMNKFGLLKGAKSSYLNFIYSYFINVNYFICEEVFFHAKRSMTISK